MSYRDSGAQLLSKILELEAQLDGLRPRIAALEATVSRLEVNVAMGATHATAAEGDAGLAQALAVNEVKDKHVAEQVGHLALRVAALEKQLAIQPRRAHADDDIRALVDEELGPRRR